MTPASISAPEQLDRTQGDTKAAAEIFKCVADVS